MASVALTLILALLLVAIAAQPATARPDFPGWNPLDVRYDAAWRRATPALPEAGEGQAPATEAAPEPSQPSEPRLLRPGTSGAKVRTLQLRLCALGFMPYNPSRGSCNSQADGRFGAKTRDAVYAVQKLHWLRRDGVVGPATLAALDRTQVMTWPSFCDSRSSTLWCVDQQRQLAWVRDLDGRVRVHHVSTGGRYTYDSRSRPGITAFAATPVGRWRIVGTKEARHETDWGDLEYTSCPSWWCLHPFESVPTYAASHGCVRRPMYLGAWGFSILRVGTYVHIVNRAPG